MLIEICSFEKNFNSNNILSAFPTNEGEIFIYPEEKTDLDLIKKMKEKRLCTVLKYGFRPSHDLLKFFYCNCDSNSIYPICEECAMNCHVGPGHTVTVQKEPANFRCSCGENAHNFIKLPGSDHLYKQKCFFHEISKTSNLNVYFVNRKNEKICLYCTNFCNGAENKRFFTGTAHEVPNCECSNPSHADINSIYYNMNNFYGTNSKIDLCGLNSIQLVNNLLKCTDSYKNLYYILDKTFENVNLQTKVTQLFTDKKIHKTNFFFALKNFALISNVNRLSYFSSDILKITPFTENFIYEILKIKFEDAFSMWSLLNYSLLVFKNIQLGYHTRKIPKFKIFDLENMSPLQRLVLMNRSKEGHSELDERFIDGSKNLINVLIGCINQVNRTHFTLIEAYEVLSTIVSILKYFSNFYLFTPTQILNFCEAFDKSFPIFSKNKKNTINPLDMSKLVEKEAQLFLKLIKMLRIFIICYNDKIILKSIKERLPKEKIKFVQDKTDVGRCIFRINMNILNITSTEYNKATSTITSDSSSYTIFNKILRHGIQNLNIYVNSIDYYGLSLKRGIPLTDSYMSILSPPSNKVNNTKNKTLLNTLNQLKFQTDLIEDLYVQFNDFKLDKSQISSAIINGIDELFNRLNINIFDFNIGYMTNNNETNDNKVIQKKRQIVVNFNVDESESNLNKNNYNADLNQSILYQSNFVFTIMKFFKMVKLNLNNTNDMKLIDRVLKILMFFIDRNSDNAIVVLAKNIYDPIISLPNQCSGEVFELLFNCVKFISRKEEYSFTKHLIKKISNYLFSLEDNDDEKYVCLNNFLKITEIFITNVKSLNFNLTINKLKKVMERIYENFGVFFSNFLKFLLNISGDAKLGRVDAKNIENFDNFTNIENKNLWFKIEKESSTMYNSLGFNIFYLFIKISNVVFDSSNNQDRKTLNKFFKKEDLIYILKNESSNLNIRTEIIKFYRRTNIDILYSDSNDSSKKIIESFVKNMDDNELKHLNNNNFPAKIFSLYETLVINSENVSYKSKLSTFPQANPLSYESSKIKSIKANSFMSDDVESCENFENFSNSQSNKEVIDFFTCELKNYQNIVESVLDIHKNKSSSILNYYENGLIVPLNLFLKKIFSVVNSLSGKEFLNIYEMFPLILQMQNYFIQKNMDMNFLRVLPIDEEEIKEIKGKIEISNIPNYGRENIFLDMFKALKGFSSITRSLNAIKFNDLDSMEIHKDLQKLRSRSFPAFDYTASYAILDTCHFNIIQMPNSIKLESYFNKSSNELEESYCDLFSSELEKKTCLLDSIDTRSMIKLAYLYDIRSGNLEMDSSSFTQGLSEICLEYELSYRIILLKFLIFLTTNSTYTKSQFSVDSYFILLKLLQYQTSNIQEDLEKIIDEELDKGHDRKKSEVHHLEENITPRNQNKIHSTKNEFKYGFLSVLSIELVNRLISIFITEFNPKDNIYNTNYIEAYNLVKIFKFLCEEHNNFFQGSLIKKISFHYTSNAKSNSSNEKIFFFELMLLILNNILLWSQWTNNNYKDQDKNDYFLDLFSAIIEMLIEIIQGNTTDNLSYISLYKQKDIGIHAISKNREPRLFSTVKVLVKENKSSFKIFMENVNNELLFSDGNSDTTLFAVRTQLMNLFLAILEEKNCSKELKDYVIESLSISKVFSSINNTLKLHFLIKTRNDRKWDEFKEKNLNVLTSKFTTKTTKTKTIKSKTNFFKNKNEITNYKSFHFNHVLYSYFYNQYFVDNEGFPESPEFEFANTLYRYIKLISIQSSSNSEAQYLIEKMYATPESDIIKEMNLIYSKTDTNNKNNSHPFSLINGKETTYGHLFCEQYFIIKFFEKLTKMVEVYNEQKSTVIFTVIPTINYLSNESKEEFLKNVNRENQYTKTYDMIRYVDYFKTEIEYNFANRKNNIYSFLKKFNYSVIQDLVYLWAILINILMFIFLSGDPRKIENYHDGDIPDSNWKIFMKANETNFNVSYINYTIDEFSHSPLMDHSSNLSKIIQYERYLLDEFVSFSADKWSVIYENMTIYLVVMCGFFILCYFLGKFPLSYEIELVKYMDIHKVKRSQISLKKKIQIICNVIINQNQINSLFFMFLIGLIAITSYGHVFEVFYSFLLIVIINLNNTLKNIRIAIQRNYKELLYTLFFTFILIYTFSSVALYFLEFRYKATLEKLEDSYCSSLLFCFLTHANGGFRIEGGLGDFLLDRYSYERTPYKYIGKILFDFIIFCTVNILMRELVFGIIIESFRDLRIEESKHEADKLSNCFICGVNKDELEKDKINFELHCEKDHNIWNYINYIMRLKFSDPQNLNAINSFTLDQIEKKYTNWIPKHSTHIEKKLQEADEQEEFDYDIEMYNESHHQLPINKN